MCLRGTESLFCSLSAYLSIYLHKQLKTHSQIQLSELQVPFYNSKSFVGYYLCEQDLEAVCWGDWAFDLPASISF